ncbi:MAG TPA: peptidylprolyl isomerase [Steroidobacteraceae bacterium]|nr:peptidylprolyl isomerase [Steroidobacteraceae bacterium]
MNHSRILLLAALLSLAACQQKASAPAAPGAPAAADNSAAVATVNGTVITRNFYDEYIKAVTGKASADLTPEQRSDALDRLVRMELVSQQAVKDGIDHAPDTAAMLELTRLNVLQQAAAEQYLKDRKPTETELREEYETQLAGLSKQEYHAKHILVATEPFAQKVIQQLEKGAKFEDVAKRESMDASKDNGGDLGWFTPDRMVKPFSDAVVALKPGEYTHKPVQTQYGWHVIELVEVRDLQPPAFDSVRQRLEQVVQAKKLKAYTDQLMKGAKIDKQLDEKKPDEKKNS